MRCTIESADKNQVKGGSEKLLKLLDHLRTARDLHEWDLADFCLERCTMPIERIAASTGLRVSQSKQPTPTGNEPHRAVAVETPSRDGSNSTAVEFLDDLFIPTDTLDYPWELLWDNAEGLWHSAL